MNFQNLQRGKLVRNIIVAPEDHYYVEMDYAAQEMRVASQVAKVKKMITAFNNDEDLHMTTAKLIVDGEVTKEARQQAKAVNFGFLFGMQASKFKEYASDSYGVTVTDAEARLMRKNFFIGYHELKAYYRSIEEDAKNLGYVEYLSGRRKRVFDESGKRFDRNSFINAKIQGFASDCLIMAYLEISELPEYGKEFQLLGTIHDAIHFYVRKGSLHVLEKIKHIMQNPKYINYLMEEEWLIPLKADIEVFEDKWYGDPVAYNDTHALTYDNYAKVYESMSDDEILKVTKAFGRVSKTGCVEHVVSVERVEEGISLKYNDVRVFIKYKKE